MSVSDLLGLRKSGMLIVNPEYQRGEVWTEPAQKRLVDSLLRGYPIPLIYLHFIKRNVAGYVQEGFEVIDGQQRIKALSRYVEGGFKLFHPIEDESEARFPNFIKEQPCSWGGKAFDDLDEADRQRLQQMPLSVVMIETEVPNEARDLFIRLQGGMPLSPQEKRDAWPGNFTEFVLKVGGKPEVDRYPGNEFFTKVMGAKVSKRGEMRQLTAQLFMLFTAHRETGQLCDIKRDDIDTFYYKHLTFDGLSPVAKRFTEILTILTKLLGDGSRKKVIGHEAIHLVLFVDSLLDDYTPKWRDKFGVVFDIFRKSLGIAKLTKNDDKPDEMWLKYGLLTRFEADRGTTLQNRHEYFAQRMLAILKPEIKDSVRIFGSIERELIYYRDKKLCQVCGGEVAWDEHEIHHVDEHHKGGKTIMENGALVHKACHPLGAKAVKFAEKWKAKMAAKETATAESDES